MFGATTCHLLFRQRNHLLNMKEDCAARRKRAIEQSKKDTDEIKRAMRCEKMSDWSARATQRLIDVVQCDETSVSSDHT